MNPLRKIPLLVKEIGLRDLASYALYAIQVRSGILQLRTPLRGAQIPSASLKKGAPTVSFDPVNWQAVKPAGIAKQELNDAYLLLEGSYRPFRGEARKLDLSAGWPLNQHWTKYHSDEDIKLTWEPARFVWALDLAQVYTTTKDERFVELFWSGFEEFQRNNPVNAGPNWSNGQEVALRLVMWLLAYSAFHDSPTTTQERVGALTRAVSQHAERILPTRHYARSQHNNHVLSEALGLVFAGEFLTGVDTRAEKWVGEGLSEFERAVLDQVDDEGAYAQHSANYQRMMLQLALLADAVLRKRGILFSPAVMNKLTLATLWSITYLDKPSGRLPNLGHNDGTLLLPFGCEDYRDYRPTIQAASRAFLGHTALAPGKWDTLSAWLRLPAGESAVVIPASPAVHRVGSETTWASLRGVKHTRRPAHADQLHVEIWHRGINLARDAGTYLYNAPPPWQNPFDRTRMHNTVTVNEKDQMERVSRFLWLDQAQASWIKPETPDTVCASHDGYRRFGITHARCLQYLPPAGFLITDTLNPRNPGQEGSYCLHWLLPDWHYQLDAQSLKLRHGSLTVHVEVRAKAAASDLILTPEDFSLIRGGTTLIGERHDELLGWESDTYNEKHPALSFNLTYQSPSRVTIETRWTINDDESQPA